MVSVNDIYGSGFINAEIATSKKLFRRTLTIVEGKLIVFNKDDPEKREEKIVVNFEETKYGLILNRTNAKTLSAKFGDETDNWPGCKVQLLKVKTAVGDSVQIDDTFDVNESMEDREDGSSSLESHSDPDKDKIKKAVKKNAIIKSIVSSMTDIGEKVNIQAIVNELKVQKTDNSITKQNYVDALELLVE